LGKAREHNSSDDHTSGPPTRVAAQRADELLEVTDEAASHPQHERGHHGAALHDKDAGHSVAMFRDRFWLSVLLTVPILIWSETMQNWLGYAAPSIPIADRVPAFFGTVVFVYGGAPFLKGGIGELRDRQPGMMLLISLAISVRLKRSCWRSVRSPDSPSASPHA
jgi:cation transport ATPase